MTEDEAEAKWCPFSRATSGTGGHEHASINRGRIDGGRDRCIASACMAWRKLPGKSQFKDARTGKLSDRDLTGNGTWIESGFCGLAGAPQ